MKQDDLINTLFHSRDPLEGLDKVQSYYDRYYDYNIIVIDRFEANKYLERIPYHLGDLVVGYVINKVTNHLIPVLGRVSMLTHCEIEIIPIRVLSKEVNDIPDNISIRVFFKKVYPIVLTPGILLKLGFSKYNVNGFSGYRKKVNGSYVKIKFDSYNAYGCMEYTMKFKSNGFHGAYLHQLMGILDLYFKL